MNDFKKKLAECDWRISLALSCFEYLNDDVAAFDDFVDKVFDEVFCNE